MNGDLARRRLSARYEVQDLDQAIAQIQQLYGAQVRRVNVFQLRRMARGPDCACHKNFMGLLCRVPRAVRLDE